jgi:SAM-dependent methyltransferase
LPRHLARYTIENMVVSTSNIVTAPRSAMVQSLIRLLAVIASGSFAIVIAVLPFADSFRSATGSSVAVKAVLMICLAVIASAASYYGLKAVAPLMDDNALAQAKFLDTMDLKYADVAILFSAALSLFLELAIIRWQSSVFPFLAFYKNFSLLACFVGLGLGYALAMRERILLAVVLPLLAWQFSFMTIVRYAGHVSLNATPFREELSMGSFAVNLPHILFLYAVLTVIFLLTVCIFLPVGQLCGRIMERRKKLRAYGLNLLGSLLGVVLMLGVSYLWTPPVAWFALCFLVILAFTLRAPSSMMFAVTFVIVCTIVLAWPANPLWNRIYSPYQLLEVGRSDDTGLTLISAAGTYYQRIYDLSQGNGSKWNDVRGYYDFPYKTHPTLTNVAVVGAGTGNDVSAALRAGSGHVEAIEIDPAILTTGKVSHPEKPYDNPRAHAVVNDARSFLRTTDQSFDLIVYGLLDSHTLLSQGSSVRLDSFVYTVEGLREARARLKPDGVLSLSFTVLSDNLGRKIYLMLQQAFDGRAPVCVIAGYDGSIIFLESNDPKWVLPPTLLKETGFNDKTAFYANPALRADISTDDWPFFYMPQRIYPTSYLIMVFQVLILSLIVGGNFLSERPKFSHLSFFFLGAGFMLVETKGITEMGLTFGNTWQVIGVVIAGILTMAFLGNCAVQWLNIKRPLIPYLLLITALAAGWYVSRSGGFDSTTVGRLETTFVLTLPLLFSGIVFSTLLTSKGQVSGMMAMNLLGAICGGLLEYNSMYFGFRFLYLIAMGCYILAFVSDWALSEKSAGGSLEPVPSTPDSVTT